VWCLSVCVSENEGPTVVGGPTPAPTYMTVGNHYHDTSHLFIFDVVIVRDVIAVASRDNAYLPALPSKTTSCLHIFKSTV